MGQDRSLDEFVGSGSDGSTSSEADEDDSADSVEVTDASGAETDPEPTPGGDVSDDADAADGGENTAAAPDDVEPAAVTYRWEPDGVECPDCGATVEQLWSGESGQVCAECKQW